MSVDELPCLDQPSRAFSRRILQTKAKRVRQNLQDQTFDRGRRHLIHATELSIDSVRQPAQSAALEVRPIFKETRDLPMPFHPVRSKLHMETAHSLLANLFAVGLTCRVKGQSAGNVGPIAASERFF